MRTTFVGICSIDLYSRIPRLPGLGETLKGNELQRGYGGKASNACAQYAFLATPDQMPLLLTAVGSDNDGNDIKQHFKNININDQLVQTTDKQPTGLAICMVLENGESSIIIHPCPVTNEMVDKCAESIRQSKIVVTNFEIPVEVAAHTLKIAHDAGAKTILNFSPCPTSPIDKEIFRNTTICIVNEVEMKTVGTSIAELHSFGVEAVIETHGGEGAFIHLKGRSEPIHVKAPKAKVVDTTGAGDSFLGSLAYFLSLGKSYEEAAKCACHIASLSVQKVGTQSSYVHRGDEAIASFF